MIDKKTSQNTRNTISFGYMIERGRWCRHHSSTLVGHTALMLLALRLPVDDNSTSTPKTLRHAFFIPCGVSNIHTVYIRRNEVNEKIEIREKNTRNAIKQIIVEYFQIYCVILSSCA